MSLHRSSARALALTAATGLTLVVSATTAQAHVTLSATSTAAGSYTILTLSVPHGCDGSATTRVAVQVPESIVRVTPTRNPLYTVAVTKKKLAQPITDSHGNQITERDDTVVYTAKTPLPDGQRDAFELSVQLPDQPGATLAFPAVQTCEKGETAWTEVATAGQDADSLEHPAPSLTITAAVGDGHAAPSGAPSSSPSPVAVAAGATGSGDNLLGAFGLGAGVLGLIAGGTALVQVRRRA